MIGYGYVAALTLLTVLALRTVAVLRDAAPWTSAGWCATIAYDLTAGYELLAHARLPLHVPYWFLVALVVAFAIAGLRDEPQGEPWWWPRRLGPTRRAGK